MSKAPLIYYVEDDEHIRDLTAYALHEVEQMGFIAVKNDARIAFRKSTAPLKHKKGKS